LAAVENLTDQSLLADRARNSIHEDVRLAAIKKLTDQSLLADVARNSIHEDVSLAAVENLTDQSLPADVARNAFHWEARRAAIEKLTDQHQELFVDQARNSIQEEVRLAATGKLTDQSILVELARNSIHRDVRVAALKKLDRKHRRIFANLTKYDLFREARLAVIEKIIDQHQELFVQLVAKTAIDKFRQVCLVIGKTSESECDAALEKLDNQQRKLLSGLVKHDPYHEVYLATMEKLTGQERLLDVTLNLLYTRTYLAEIEALLDAVLFKKIVINIFSRAGKYRGKIREQVDCLEYIASKKPGIITENITREEWEERKQQVEERFHERARANDDYREDVASIPPSDEPLHFPPYPAPVDQTGR
ncbi:MAG: hypothetical protein LBF09_01405, partial [Odoribacteraceae bacterium]|nr:hypothetical protein [Odoribacteraceae bacterium]